MFQITINGEPRQFPEPLSVAALLETLKLLPRQVAVEVNQRVVPRAEHATAHLKNGDAVEIVTFVGGG